MFFGKIPQMDSDFAPSTYDDVQFARIFAALDAIPDSVLRERLATMTAGLADLEFELATLFSLD